jgi:hypothetical protein
VKRQKEKPTTKRQRPYEALRHLIGIADSGGQRLSENTGEKFFELLRKKRAEGRL